ncbi:MAG TPA: HTTM domain-containing protein [Ferruginibacter sp.]|nr:HTTM domain-containing protein [Ferruginibacter sp.]HMP19583.1 HTTM domain-containing protein [Ferruginibacter sp.]
MQQFIHQLQQRNYKAYYLAILRVAVCVWFLVEMLQRWPTYKLMYSSNSFLKIYPEGLLDSIGIDTFFLREHYVYMLVACIMLLLLNLLGIGRNLVAFLLFIAYVLLYNMNNRFGNGGDKMSVILLFYLSFANTYSHFTLLKRKPLPLEKEGLYNLVSNLAAYGIMINLAIVYFVAGLSKLNEPYWQQGTAIHYFINDDRYSVFAYGGRLVQWPQWFNYSINYGTVALELVFPFAVWFKKGRNIVLLLCLIMHLGIYLFLMIYGMSLIFLIQYGLFFSEEEVKGLAKKIKGFFTKRFSFAST